MFCLCNERLSVIGSNQREAQLLIATFVKGLCRGTLSLYLDLRRSLYVYTLTSSEIPEPGGVVPVQ